MLPSSMRFSIINAAIAATALADFDGNLNYRSPSLSHPGLGIDVPKVVKRTSSNTARQYSSSQLNFTHGVASGDPYPNSVILWTRVSPVLENDRSNITVEGSVSLYNHDTEIYVEHAASNVCVNYKVASDKNLTSVVDSGKAYTSSDIDYTVKVEAKNLEPFSTYYYQFNVCGSTTKSPIGRTKTIPDADDNTEGIKLAVFSCSNYPNGYFNAYGNAARKDDVDYFIHLGDYIYESESGTPGVDERAAQPPREIVTLYDYRTRIAQYRTDLDLLLAHEQFPWITTWDDHEMANNGYRDGFSNMNNTEESFVKYAGVSVDQRKMNAVRAYFEWMPIRQVDMDDNLRIWRSFSIGNLFDFIVLDTRNYDRSITTLDYNDDYIYDISNDAGRTLMGSHQENWFYNQLTKSKNRGATWRVIGNQIVFSRINITSWFGSAENPYNGDQWDGYIANRNRTFQHLYTNNIKNNIMLAGDSHANWVSDLVWLDTSPYDTSTGLGSVGVEFAGTAVSSSGYGTNRTQENSQARKLIDDNLELMWSEGYYRGYFELEVTREKAMAMYFGCPSVKSRNAWEVILANFTTLSSDDGDGNGLQRPVAGGSVLSGALKGGEVTLSDAMRNTETGEWEISNFTEMFIGGD